MQELTPLVRVGEAEGSSLARRKEEDRPAGRSQQDELGKEREKWWCGGSQDEGCREFCFQVGGAWGGL